MATVDATTLSFHIEPKLKDALRVTSKLEHRSIANMTAMLNPGLLQT